jgi:hypothetical protein
LFGFEFFSKLSDYTYQNQDYLAIFGGPHDIVKIHGDWEAGCGRWMGLDIWQIRSLSAKAWFTGCDLLAFG